MSHENSTKILLKIDEIFNQFLPTETFSYTDLYVD